MSESKAVDLCDWYAEEYGSGAVNSVNYRESAAFLRGFYTALDVIGKMDSEGASAMERAISTLQAGGGFIESCRRHKALVRP